MEQHAFAPLGKQGQKAPVIRGGKKTLKRTKGKVKKSQGLQSERPIVLRRN